MLNPALLPFSNSHVVGSSLVIPLPLHQTLAKNSINTASSPELLFHLPNHMSSHQWVSDSSSIDSIGSVLTVLVGPQPVALWMVGSKASSIQGEVLALISTAILIASQLLFLYCSIRSP